MFKSLHPSESGGSGREIDRAKYAFPTDRPEDFIECYQCGWKKDLLRTVESDTLQAPVTYGAAATATVTQPVYNGAIGHNFSDTTIEPSVSGGCPFCGSMNSRGRLGGSDFGSAVDISNL